MFKSHKILGFSLVELMIVIAVLGLMLASAIPSYNTYVKKGQVASVLAFMESFKPQIVEKLSLLGACPSTVTMGSITYSSGSPYNPSDVNAYMKGGAITQLTYFASSSSNTNRPLCQIRATLNSSLGGGNFDLQIMPNSDNGTLDIYCGFWSNGSGEMANSLPYVPSSCSRSDLSQQ